MEHAEWLGLLLDHEVTTRNQKQFEARACAARLRMNATIEDVNYRAARGLDRTMFLKLTTCDWIRAGHDLLITGPTGLGKVGWSALSVRKPAATTSRSSIIVRPDCSPLSRSPGLGRHDRLMRSLGRVELLILTIGAPRN
jgi:hypothetical protein